MTEEQTEKKPTIQTGTEELAGWFSYMKKTYHLQESTLMDLFRIQLMWMEQTEQRKLMAEQQRKSGQQMVDEIAAEVRAADEEIKADD